MSEIRSQKSRRRKAERRRQNAEGRTKLALTDLCPLKPLLLTSRFCILSSAFRLLPSAFCFLAERVGFEPTVQFPVHSISSAAS